nr:rRNA N6-adenosine-methyltransferase ZCCHC4-like isoform X1 [Lepeophtheirus salmonis]
MSLFQNLSSTFFLEYLEFINLDQWTCNNIQLEGIIMDGLKSRPQKKKLSRNLLQMKSQFRVIPQESLLSNPTCPHGPTILFQRVHSSAPEQFFACSAFRDPKECRQNQVHSKDIVPWNGKDLPLLYCHTCSSLDSASSTSHSNHEYVSPVDITLPSTFLKPLDDDKAQAQYHFQTQSAEFILNCVSSAKDTAVLCIGAPTIHEKLKIQGVKSIMLDIDHRYASFYPMLQYNMFNHYFFNKSDEEVYKEFLRDNKKCSLSIVMDPPFGGKVELLSATLTSIEKDWNHSKNKPRIFWIFPYFMENNIIEACGDLRMMGVPIEYNNHAKYSRRKQGSPVRLFTNISLKKIPLKGKLKKLYRKCNICQVVTCGMHCDLCGQCPSKNGGSYSHCSICKRCVKDSWSHCMQCNRCALPDHPCDLFIRNKKRKLND